MVGLSLMCSGELYAQNGKGRECQFLRTDSGAEHSVSAKK